MVVHDLDIFGVSRPPPKTDPPLIVDANAVLPGSVSSKLLQPVAWRTAKVVQGLGRIQDQELAQRHPLQLKGPPAHPLALEDSLGVLIPKALEHPG